jgi:hypothetical protein
MLDAARRSADAAAEAHRAATALTVGTLLRHFSLRDAASILDISYQRVQRCRDESPTGSEWELSPSPFKD